MLVNRCSHQRLNPENSCFLFRLRLIFLVYIYVTEKQKKHFLRLSLALSGCDTLLLIDSSLPLSVFFSVWQVFSSTTWLVFLVWSSPLFLLHILELFSQMCRPNYFLCVLDVYVDISCCVLRGFIHICTLSFSLSLSLYFFRLVFSLFLSLCLVCWMCSAETLFFLANLRKDFKNKDRIC